jgi:hypothetical protein
MGEWSVGNSNSLGGNLNDEHLELRPVIREMGLAEALRKNCDISLAHNDSFMASSNFEGELHAAACD